MQQRQLRLGDILDDYCPRERRVTNHAIVAMVGAEVKQTRCTTCDAEHEYKHAKVPRPRRKVDPAAALGAEVGAGVPRRSAGPEQDAQPDVPPAASTAVPPEEAPNYVAAAPPILDEGDASGSSDEEDSVPELEDGPVHRPLIRATLPRVEGQPPPTRPGPDFTIRQPGGRPSRFRPRHAPGGSPYHGNRSNGNVAGPRGGGRHGGRSPQGHHQGPAPHAARRHGQGRKRSK
jgi:hypothetical protein